MGRSASEPVVPLRLAGEWDVYPPEGFLRRLRYYLKEATFLLYLKCGWVQVRDLWLSMRGRSRIVILFYHRVGWMDRLSKPTSAFRGDVRYIAKHFECLTLGQLVERLKCGAPIRRKIAVVTFDDGYRDNYLSAFPQLKRAGIAATFFVSTGFIGTTRKFEHDTRALEAGQAARDDWAKMTWQELREMQQAGMEIGSHTVEHANMACVPMEDARREARESLETLRRELGEGPRTFCFPWGKPGDVSDAAVEAVREAGYVAAVTTSAGPVLRGDDLFRLRRNDAGNGHYSRLGARAMIEGFGCGWLARLLRQ